MKIMKSIKNAVVAGCMYTALVFGAGNASAEEQKVNWGFNALETAITNDENVRTRALTNVDALLGDSFEIGYHGLNEVENLEGDSYFGIHDFTIGMKDWPVDGVLNVKTDSFGIFDRKVGLRNESLMEMLGGYGYLEALADQDSANLTVFYGKPFENGLSLELYHSMDFTQDGNFNYSEVQLNKDLTKNWSLFGRIELPDFDFDGARYLVGITLKN